MHTYVQTVQSPTCVQAQSGNNTRYQPGRFPTGAGARCLGTPRQDEVTRCIPAEQDIDIFHG
jgi:hypothetical protein